MSGEHSLQTRLSIAGLLMGWVFIGFLVWHAFWSAHGLFSLTVLENKIAEIEARNRQLENQNEALLDEVTYRRSQLFLEELLRTELGFARPGEHVVRFIPSRKDSAVSPTATVSFPETHP